MLDAVGYIGSLAFALCALPQAFKSIGDGHSKGLSWGFLLLWLCGEVCTIVYSWGYWLLPLLGNYVGNMIMLSIILYYKVFPRKEK